MNSETVDLVYLDPPFNTGAEKTAAAGSAAAHTSFKDTWTADDLDAEHADRIQAGHPMLWRVVDAAMTDPDRAYLVYMAVRILEMRRLLKTTGSLYLHCDPVMSHYLKLVCDAVFGRDRFRNEIVWHYGLGGGFKAERWFPRKHDVILYYAKSRRSHHNKIRGNVSCHMAAKYRHEDCHGKYFVQNGTKYYLKGGKPFDTVWDGDEVFEHTMSQNSSERLGFPTQKPLALLHRIIRASSDPGDVVLDPFCGSGTALAAADDLARSWAGIDINPQTAEVAVERIRQRQGLLFRRVTLRSDIPRRTDMKPRCQIAV